jgi:hypothetical protein
MQLPKVGGEEREPQKAQDAQKNLPRMYGYFATQKSPAGAGLILC